MVMNVPYTRMNETMRMVQRMGGKIVAVAVNGGDLTTAKAPRKSNSRSSSAKAKTED
jgi:phycocyanin-associated rod protein